MLGYLYFAVLVRIIALSLKRRPVRVVVFFFP